MNNGTEEAGSKAAKKQKSTTELSFQAAPLPRPPKANEGKIIGVKRERVSTHKDVPPEGEQGNEPNAHQRDRNHALREEDGASCTSTPAKAQKRVTFQQQGEEWGAGGQSSRAHTLESTSRGETTPENKSKGEHESQPPRANDTANAPATNSPAPKESERQGERQGAGAQSQSEYERVRQNRHVEGKSQTIEPVKALVSSTQELHTSMLVRTARIGARLCEAHLDTCASHCFVSETFSLKWTEWGYPPYDSPVRYAVEQGNPLCIASRVHILPLAMIQTNGVEVRWTTVLFIVANCGADVIIGYPTLKQGGIVEYEPPSNYETLLAQGAPDDPAGDELLAEATRILHLGRGHLYGPPESKFDWESVPTSVLSTFTKPTLGVKTVKTPKPHTGSKSKIKTPLVAALTETEPYGKNPPLPEVVMEALSLLKNLAEDRSFTYTPSQLDEVKEKLKSKRPTWANCLTLQHLEEVTDRETEKLLNEMMDRPRYQKSIFQTAMHLSTVSDFTDFEINQLPGRDNWNPAQPTTYKNPYTTKVVDDWLDTLM
jgi:hypothetical protein